MAKFWDYLYFLPEPTYWVFTINHLYLLAFVVGLILMLTFLLPRKNEKAMRVTFLALGITLATLEILRIVWAYGYYTARNAPTDAAFWWWTISFQICAISAWSTVFTMMASFFLKKDHPVLQFMYPILLGMALVGAALAFVYPDMIEEMKPFFHFRNLQTVVTLALLIFSPIYLIRTRRYVVKMSDLWKVAFGWFSAICISMSASLISGQCFGFSLNCNLMEAIGLFIPFPFHLILLGLIMMAISFSLFKLLTLGRNRKGSQTAEAKGKLFHQKKQTQSTVFLVASGVIGLTVLFVLAKSVPLTSWWGLACLLPIPLTGSLLHGGFLMRAKAHEVAGSLQTETATTK